MYIVSYFTQLYIHTITSITLYQHKEQEIHLDRKITSLSDYCITICHTCIARLTRLLLCTSFCSDCCQTSTKATSSDAQLHKPAIDCGEIVPRSVNVPNWLWMRVVMSGNSAESLWSVWSTCNSSWHLEFVIQRTALMTVICYLSSFLL